MYPKILDLGPLTIHTYGLLLAAAFIAGIWITSRNARKAGISPDLIWKSHIAQKVIEEANKDRKHEEE